ncbi:warthog protein 8 [Ditylenchus destructor]|nr:warthog protein 8 [Ditylenchus destructor]
MTSSALTLALIILGTIPSIICSYCGQAAIPFSLEILPNGQPVLGCARPSCFGWDAKGRRAADAAQFYKIDKAPDGFLRTSDVKGPLVKNATGFKPQYSICDRSYISDQCSGTTWVGGIAPSAKIDNNSPMKLMCCSYNKLAEAVSQGQEELRAGQAIKGGEMQNGQGRQHAFEYISNVQRLFDRHGFVYVVTMKKFPCVPLPATNVSDADKFLVENINAMDTKASSIPAGSNARFEDQKFELPHDMPQEDVQKQAVLNSAATNDDYEAISSLQQDSAVVEAPKINNLKIPSAKPMDEETEDTRRSPEKSAVETDAKAAGYQKYAAGTRIEKPDSPQNQNYASQQSQASYAPAQSQYGSSTPNNQYSQQYGYQQQQSQQYPYQSSSQYNGAFSQQRAPANPWYDPYGLFTRYTQNYGTQNNNYQNYGQNPAGNGYYGNSNSQQVYQQQQQPLQPTLVPAFSHIPPSGRRLLATVANTLMGFNRFI